MDSGVVYNNATLDPLLAKQPFHLLIVHLCIIAITHSFDHLPASSYLELVQGTQKRFHSDGWRAPMEADETEADI